EHVVMAGGNGHAIIGRIEDLVTVGADESRALVAEHDAPTCIFIRTGGVVGVSAVNIVVVNLKGIIRRARSLVYADVIFHEALSRLIDDLVPANVGIVNTAYPVDLEELHVILIRLKVIAAVPVARPAIDVLG